MPRRKVTRNKVVFEVEEIAKAFKGKVINLSVRSKTIGSAIATDIDALAARAYLMAVVLAERSRPCANKNRNTSRSSGGVKEKGESRQLGYRALKLGTFIAITTNFICLTN